MGTDKYQLGTANLTFLCALSGLYLRGSLRFLYFNSH